MRMRIGHAAAVLSLLATAAAGQDPAAADPPRPDAEAQSAPPAPADVPLDTVPVPPETAVAPPPDEPTQLDEIVVTAQKVKQPLRKVPVSVTALGGDFIAQTGSPDLAHVSLYIPNVRVDADDLGSPQVFIRGFGTNAFNPSFESSVAFVQDEIYFGRPGYFTEAMFDVDRVEVLRGPQGTLFGKNTVAGVFNVISRGATAQLSADAHGYYGANNERRLEGGVGGMLNDWAGGRVAALWRQQDGELVNTYLSRNEESLDQQAARVKLQLSPLSRLENELTVVQSGTTAPFWPLQLMNLDGAPQTDTRQYLEGFDPDIEDDPTDFRTEFDTPGFIDKGSTTAALKNTWSQGDLWSLHDVEALLVLGASKFHIDQLNELDVSPADIARLDNHEHHRQTSAELRFTGGADSLFGLGTGVQFVGGAYYFQSDYVLLARVLAGQDLGSYVGTRDFCILATGNPDSTPLGGPVLCDATPPAPGGSGSPALGMPAGALTAGDEYRFDYTQGIDSKALFGQMTWNLTERWAVTPGVRVNFEHKDVDTAARGHCQGESLGQPCFMAQLLQANDYSQRGLARSETDVSPKLAVQYFAPFDVNFYASYARGYKSGGFNSLSFTGDDLEYAPETAKTLEAGIKSRFFGKTLDLNLGFYRTQFDNLQVLAFNGVFFDVSNAASAKSQGLEMDFRWITPYEPLRIMGSAGLLDARYDQYDDAPAPVHDANGDLQINAKQSLAGQRIAFAPKATATLTPMLTYLFGSYMTSAAVDVLYQGDQYTDTDLDPYTHVDAYTKLAARLMFGPSSGLWSVSLGGQNLTDERVLNQVTDALFFPGTYYAQQAGGRQLFGMVNLQF
ncbi:MAG TPA: TonB-dependent receptor [Candidatus Binatia bacterium]|nr:TonB-dependent receptor [Candidatus Binatia bacterium]